MFKLIIGNRAYSSWSMRGWLACKQSGEEFEELVVPMFDADWEKRREGDEFAPSLGKVPILWDGEIVVWDSLAIIEFLADRYGSDALLARGRGRARRGALDGGGDALGLRQSPPRAADERPQELPAEGARATRCASEIDRILQLWAQARARFGGTGDFLFGDWCAADMMYAPVVTRFITYGVTVPNFAGVYMKNVLSHPHVAEWIDKAQDEPWVIEQYEAGKAA